MKKIYVSPNVRCEFFETADIITVSRKKMTFTITFNDPTDVEKLDTDELFTEST